MSFRRHARWWVAPAILNLILLVPLWVRFGEPTVQWLALEALVLAGLMVMLPTVARIAWLRWLIIVIVMLGLLLGLGDAATQLTFGRSLNLYLDFPLTRSVIDLLIGNLGLVPALLVVLGGLVAVGLLVGSLAWTLRVLQGVERTRISVGLGAVLLVVSSGLVMAEFTHSRWLPMARTPLLNTLYFQLDQWVETRRAHREFAARMENAPAPAREMPGLAGKNVLLVFIESYGVSALFDERYMGVVRPRLDTMAERFESAGLSIASGTLDSPIRGGQSWLAHATALSGQWIDNSLWYRLMLASDRATLVDDFRASGHRTHAVMPAITLAWPEGEAYGFDDIHAADDFDYAGPPLNWVTMPDQYTLHFLQQRILDPAESPIFAQAALVSSHAPWTPVIPVLAWEDIGDGSVFKRWENAGEAPEVLWQDAEKVRDQYALALDYALHTSASWAERYVDDETLLILLGDHQSAPLITGEDASAGVPVHVISGDASLIDPFLARGFVPGTVPLQEETPPGMDQLRRWLHEDFAYPVDTDRRF
ncbi:alkaline phosphatase [Halomonas sp. TRM85114]|uniref:alkaline phosphatase n=1 Tax=Halomonas jincaotanensis TaxID=2810616 RepID=UPI001BD31DBE|nr:alkaline phosphatase [Halomonas jincaotanensis]MBS9404540.1 alkaline phosphatase [Halomonas jincaotanensis]